MFTSYAGGDFGIVKMVNHGVTEVVGIGNVIVVTNIIVNWFRRMLDMF